MKHFLASFVVLLAGGLLVAPEAFAQSYPGSYAGNSCVSINRTLTRGSRGADVTSLQQYLVANNYIGSWAVTGYFGAGTTAAVRNFQVTHGISATGSVGPQTRAALMSDCGYSFDYNPYPMPSYPTYPTYPTTPYYPYPVVEQPTISSVSPLSGSVGSMITVQGAGFTAQGNTVHFGRGIITNLRSPDGSALTFAVPAQLTGYGNETVTLTTYPIYVTNSGGLSSNTLPFTVTGLATSQVQPTISNLQGPTNLAVGATGTWSITAGGAYNTNLSTFVTWGDEQYYSYNSSQAAQEIYLGSIQQQVTFTHVYQQAGTYTVRFRVRNNQSGLESLATMTVVVTGSTTGGNVSLSSIQPNVGSTGTTIVLTGSGFSTTGNDVHFGIGGTRNVAAINGGTIYYTVPHYVSPCDFTVGMCSAPAVLVQNGSYPIFVTNAQGTSQTFTFTVSQ